LETYHGWPLSATSSTAEAGWRFECTGDLMNVEIPQER